MKKRSLALVTVDCLRADHVGVQKDGRSLTPFLDSMAESSIVFSEAIVAGAPTYFSFPAIIASRYPLGLGRELVGMAPNEPTIATALRANGYATAAFLAGNPYLSPRFGYHHGFDEFHDFLDATPLEESTQLLHRSNQRLSDLNRLLESISRHSRLTSGAYNELYFRYCQWRSGRENLSLDQLRRYPAADFVIDQVCSWLSKFGGDSFFLWVHLMDAHHPYCPPQEALSELGASHMSARRARFLNACWNRGDIGPKRLQRYRSDILSLYGAGVRWADKQISRFVGALQQSNRWDETVFVVTADHGEEFLEHGTRYHSPANLPESLIHVPLIVHAPGLPGVRISQRPFSLIHLAPTLLEAVGVDVPPSFQGKSGWRQISAGDLPDEPAITECIEACNNPLQIDERIRPRVMAIRDRDYKLIIHFGNKTDHFYDLENDPGEKSPLPSGVLTKERARLWQMARVHLENARANRNTDFAIGARLHELRQLIRTRSGKVPATVSE